MERIRKSAVIIAVFVFLCNTGLGSWVKTELKPGTQTIIIEQLVPISVTKMGTSANTLKVYISSDFRIPAPENQVIPVNRGIIKAASWIKVGSDKVILNLEFVGNAIRPRMLMANNNILLQFEGEEFEKQLPLLDEYAQSQKMRNPAIANQLLSDLEVFKRKDKEVSELTEIQDESDSQVVSEPDSGGPVLSYTEELPAEAVNLGTINEGGFDLSNFLLSPITLGVFFLIGLILIIFGLKELLGIKIPFFSKKKEGGETEGNKKGRAAGKEKTTAENESEEQVSKEETFSAKLAKAIEEVNQADQYEDTLKEGNTPHLSGKKETIKKDRVIDHNIIYQLYLQGHTPEYLAKELKLSLAEIHIAMKVAEESSEIGPDKRDKIFQLSKIGLNNDQIARQLKLSVESVNLILWQGQA